MSVVLACAFFAIVIFFDFLWTKRSKSIVSSWAARNGLALVNIERRRFRQGSWTMNVATTMGHRVFHVTLVNDSGSTTSALIRVAWYLGNSESGIEVKWST